MIANTNSAVILFFESSSGKSFTVNKLAVLSNMFNSSSSVSISSNIAEGASRSSAAEFAHYLEIAIGSTFEVETQLLIAKKRNYITEETYDGAVERLQLLARQLNAFISKVRSHGLK